MKAVISWHLDAAFCDSFIHCSPVSSVFKGTALNVGGLLLSLSSDRKANKCITLIMTFC